MGRTVGVLLVVGAGLVGRGLRVGFGCLLVAAGAGGVKPGNVVAGRDDGRPVVPVPGSGAGVAVAALRVVAGPTVALRVLATDPEEVGNPLRELVVPVGSSDMGPSIPAPPPATTLSTATAASAPPATPTACSAPVALDGAREAR